MTSGTIPKVTTVNLSVRQLSYVTGLPQTTQLFVTAALAYGTAGQLNARLLGKFGRESMMRFGFFCMIIGGLLMLVLTQIIGDTIWTIITPTTIFLFGSVFIFPSAFASALTPFGHIAELGGALYSFLQVLGGTTLGLLVAHLPDKNALPLTIIYLFAPISSLILFEDLVIPGERILNDQK